MQKYKNIELQIPQPGVAAVITGEDIKKYSDPFLNVIKVPGMNLWSLSTDRVRYVGEAVACVVAKDRYLAEDALDFIEVTYNGVGPFQFLFDITADEITSVS